MERAWLTFEQIQVVGFAELPLMNIRKGILFRPVFQNTGRTPALQVGAVVAVRVISREAELPIFSPEFPETNRTAVGPNQLAPCSNELVRLDDIYRMIGGSHRIIVYGAVEYVTIDGRHARTEWCSEVHHSNTYEVISGNTDPSQYFVFTAVGTQNSAT